MRHDGSRTTRRPVVIVMCTVIRVGRCLRARCEPYVRSVARVAVRVAACDGEGATTLTAHVIVAAASSAAFSIGAAVMGVGPSELCKIAGAVVVGALALSAATMLIRRRLGAGRPPAPAFQSLLASATRQVLADHAHTPAARVLRVVLAPRRSAAVATVGVAIAALAPPLPLGEPSNAALLRLALRPATRLLPAMGVALDVHGAYRHSRESARFVREFALAAVASHPVPATLPALCA